MGVWSHNFKKYFLLGWCANGKSFDETRPFATITPRVHDWRAALSYCLEAFESGKPHIQKVDHSVERDFSHLIFGFCYQYTFRWKILPRIGYSKAASTTWVPSCWTNTVASRGKCRGLLHSLSQWENIISSHVNSQDRKGSFFIVLFDPSIASVNQLHCGRPFWYFCPITLNLAQSRQPYKLTLSAIMLVVIIKLLSLWRPSRPWSFSVILRKFLLM